MLFNSTEFILFFLPCVLLLFFQLGRQGYYRLAIALLVAASLFFYSWWNPANLIILISSILFNYCVGSTLTSTSSGSLVRRSLIKQSLLVIGIVVNLAAIGYFKYANFLVHTANEFLQTNFYFSDIVLPLGISFFTFQQIAFLVDSYRGQIEYRYRFLDYCLFVTFFPHLIAGPLLHHKEIISQLTDRSIFRFNINHLTIGITVFAIGLFKKVILADSVATYATQVFDAATDGETLTLIEAWVGALSYSLQLYFDFSGYCDMAIGIGALFGIQLPINFNSPYKAVNIIDFWRRWHITLSNYLRDYLYISLGGNRQGEVRRNFNLIVTMLLGGLWHGAGWTFVLWGGLHGVYLLINHQWRSFRQRMASHNLSQIHKWETGLSWLITFVAVVVSWVIFRAENINTAVAILGGMFSFNGISLPEAWAESLAFLQNLGVQFEGLMPNLTIEIANIEDVNEVEPGIILLRLAVLLGVVWLMPNTQQWIADYGNTLNSRQASEPIAISTHANLHSNLWKNLQWRPNWLWAIISAILTTISLLNLSRISEFLYFEF